MNHRAKPRSKNLISRTEDLLERADRALVASDRLIDQTRRLLDKSQALCISSRRSQVRKHPFIAAGQSQAVFIGLLSPRPQRSA